MAVKYATEAFVFKKEDRMDADRVFSVFAKDFGRLEVFGKAIRNIDSKLRGGIDIFSLCRIEFVQGKNKKTLTDALALQKFKSIAGDPEKLEIANAICQVAHEFLKGQEKDEKILALLVEVFGKLQAGRARKLIYYYFFWNFMALLGHGADPASMKVPLEATVLLRLITQKDWTALETAMVPPAVQKSFQQISDHHYALLKESYA